LLLIRAPLPPRSVRETIGRLCGLQKRGAEARESEAILGEPIKSRVDEPAASDAVNPAEKANAQSLARLVFRAIRAS